jgi:hypothetical protein
VVGGVAQQTPENHLQGVEQPPIPTLNEIAGQPKQPKMTRRVPFSARRGGFSMAGANQIHNAIAGGRNYALDALEFLLVVLEKLSHGYAEGRRYLAQRLGSWLEMAIFNPGKVRPGEARASA